MSATWDGLPAELRTKILEFTISCMVIDFVPRAKLAKRRKNRNKKPDQTQNELGLLYVSRSFLTLKELNRMIRNFAVFKYRETQQFFMLDKRFGANSVWSIRQLCLSVNLRDVRVFPTYDEFMMPMRHFRAQLTGLQTFKVLIEEDSEGGALESFALNATELAKVAFGDDDVQGDPNNFWLNRGPSRADGFSRDLSSVVRRLSQHGWGTTFDAWLEDFLTPTPNEPFDRFIQLRIALVDIWDKDNRQTPVCFEALL